MARIANSKDWQDRNKKWVVGYTCGWCRERFDIFQTEPKKSWEYTSCPACGWENCECVDEPAHFQTIKMRRYYA